MSEYGKPLGNDERRKPKFSSGGNKVEFMMAVWNSGPHWDRSSLVKRKVMGWPPWEGMKAATFQWSSVKCGICSAAACKTSSIIVSMGVPVVQSSTIVCVISLMSSASCAWINLNLRKIFPVFHTIQLWRQYPHHSHLRYQEILIRLKCNIIQDINPQQKFQEEAAAWIIDRQNSEQRGYNKDEEVLELKNEWISIACWQLSRNSDQLINQYNTIIYLLWAP